MPQQPKIMGIVNVTPDSFSDGNHFFNPQKAIDHALQLASEGADILDIGGESTNPNSSPISEQEELDRVLPVIEALHKRVDIDISIDTSSPQVMQQAVSCGASMINDVRALRRDKAIETVARLNVPVCIMHMRGEPATMQQDTSYQDVVTEIKEYLQQRMAACVAAGISTEKIVIDPGIGFGKTWQHNVKLIQQLAEFKSLGAKILLGPSRKSFIGAITGAPVTERIPGSIAAAVLGAQNGADIIRMHDVAETLQALKVLQAVEEVADV